MNGFFADTFYFFALLNSHDEAHRKALEFSESHDSPLITTAWVLTELADGLPRSVSRVAFPGIVEKLRENPLHMIVPPSERLFQAGCDLYRARPDKKWSLTDCISFEVMREHGLTDALTADHHFEQAGFKCLLV